MKMPYRKWIKPVEAPITWILILAFCISQVTLPPAEAANPGTSTVSAGSAPTPAATVIESFQPDLFTGRATAGVPIVVPPGRKGLQPQLALSYSSAGRNGWLGVGWGLTLGFVERSTKYGVPKYNDTDTFSFQLGGGSSELVKLTNGTYRAEDEGLFMKFENLGTNGWQVTDKSGTRYLMGRTSASRVENGTLVYQWCLDKVIDVNGNTMELTYEKSNTVVATLQEIRYTGHEPSGLAPANKVVFYNESRPDTTTTYRAGFEMKMNRRLSRIETFAKVGGVDRLAMRYNLSYRQSARTGQSLLGGVTQVGSDGATALPPRTFTYQETDSPTYSVNLKRGAGSQVAWNVRHAGADMGHDNFGCVDPYSGLPWGSSVVVSNSYNFGGVRVSVGTDGSISFNGDRDNFVHAWTAVYVASQKTITISPAGGWDVVCMYLQSGGYPEKINTGSVTLKAGWSIIHLVGYHQHDGFSGGNANSLVSQVDLMSPNIVTEPQLAGDADGNGINDLINFKNGTWNVSLASSAGTLAPPQTWLTGFGDNGYLPLVGDWNADGRADVALYSNGVWRFAVSSGSNYAANAISQTTFGSGIPVAGDFNGDGIVDLGTCKEGQWRVALGTGAGFSSASQFDLLMAEGAPVLSPHDVRWIARIASYDCGHDNYGCVAPYSPGNCGQPNYSIGTVSGTMNVGGINVSVGSNGDIWIPAGQDRHTWASTCLYLKTGKSVYLPSSGGWDVACLYIEPQGGSVSRVNAGWVSLGAGWTTIHITGYNQNQGISYGLGADLRNQADIVSPTIINANVSTAQFITGDFNGDGLTDVAIVKDQQVYPALSTGGQFVRTGPWAIPFGDKDYTTADYNGDGLTDIAWYDRSNGKVKVVHSTGGGLGSTLELPPTFSLRLAHDQIQVGEWNGDGLPDLCIIDNVSGDIEMGYSSGTTADLLRKVDNGLGGVGELTYQPSTRMVNDFLPMVMPVVTETRAGNGMGETNTMKYTYAKGFYDSATKEFRGFGHVESRDADQTSSVNDFHQDYQRKGRVYQSAIYDVSGNLWRKEQKTYSSSTPYPGLNAFFTHLDQADAFVYDGDLTFTQTRVRHAYDAYGNLTASYIEGDVNTTGDEKSTVTTYNLNPSAWILNTPSLVQSFDASSNLVSQVRTYYDGATDLATPPAKGNPTSEEKWLNVPAVQWIGTRIGFDAYGNPAVVTDALGRTTTNGYDSTYTFLTAGTSPLGHKRAMTYDPRNGLMLSITDQNNVIGYSAYDALGRKTSQTIVNPATGQTNVQAEMEYRVSSVPARIKTTAYTQPGRAGGLTTYVFSDGWGRRIQTRGPAEEPGRQNVTGAALHDAKGQMIKQWTAYSDAFSEEYVAPPVASLATPEEYTYDPVGRITSTKTANGSISTIAYNDDVTTYTDARNNVQRRYQDGYGRVVKVEENNGAATYITQYAYDSNNRLVRTIDHNGNTVTCTYDSLGRRIATDDPNMGHWAYEYNAKNMMTKQTDARGVVVQFTYDTMDRLLRKDYTTPSGVAPMTSAVYTYDEAGVPFSVGELTKMTDASGTTQFSYDFMNRVVKESRTVDGTKYDLQTGYDLMGRLTNFVYPNGHSAGYAYNAGGGVEGVSLKAGTNTYRLITNITYNAAGKVTRVAYGNGMASDYTYNPQTLKIDHKRTVNGAGTVLQDLAYTRDPVGNIDSITDTVNTGTQTFQYDALNRLTQAVGASYGTQTFAYDAIGNMTTKAGVTMTYGGPRPHAVMTTSSGLAMSYDADGNMTGKVSSATGVRLAMKYDAENRLAEVQSGVQVPSNVTLSAGMNMVGFPSLGSAATLTNVLKQFGTAYSQVSRLRPQDQKFESSVGNPAYDQLTTLTPGDGCWVYCTNVGGATMSLPSTAGTPGARSLTNGWQLLSGPARGMSVAQWLSPLVQGTDYGTVKAYDIATASMVATDQVVAGKAYYVQILRPCSWTPPAAGGTETAAFVYDGDGGRVKKTTSAGTTLFLGNGYELQGTNFIEYVLNGADRIASLDSAGALRYYLTDHLNSANLVVDSSGQVVELAEYAPYGQLSRRTGAMNTPFKFTGQRLDAESGLYYMNARYYDPELGRFAAPDTVTPDSFNPQSLNRYTYALNNPILFTDPSGNFFIIDDIIFAIVTFVVANAGAIAMGAVIGAALNVAMAAIMGGDLGQAALLGAVSGAITAGFGAWGAGVMKGVADPGMYALGKGAFDAVGASVAGAAGAAIKGEPIGKGAWEGFKMSVMMSAGNYVVGRWSGWSKDVVDPVRNGPYHDGMTVGASGILTDGKANALAGPQMYKGIEPPGYGKPFDVFFAGKSHGPLQDIVECAQDLLFGPGSQSRSLARYIEGMAGYQVNIIAHSQGTISMTRALQIAGNSGVRFGAGSTVTFNNPPIDPISAFTSARSCGVGTIGYHPNAWDIVSAIGSPILFPTSLAGLPNLQDNHCGAGFAGSGAQ